MITQQRLESVLAAFPRLTIALVGDLYLDRYLEIDPGVEEVSVETGLEAHQISRVRNSPGALGTLMNNLSELGVGLLVPVSVIGDDGHGYDLREALKRLPIDPVHILSDPDRLTPTYTKPLKRDSDGSWRELNRLDVRSRRPLSDAASQQLCEHLRHVTQSSDGVIVLDQIVDDNCGVIDDRTRRCLSELAQQSPDKLFFVDSRAHLDQFSFGVLKGNAAELVGDDASSDDVAAVGNAAAKLARRTGLSVYCTLGERGMIVVRPDRETVHVPGYAIPGPVDIVGAGDSATSGVMASLLAGADEIEAAAVGNLVASITVQQLDATGAATAKQVLDRWRQTLGDSE